jgi:hypothetical protein
LEGRSAEGGAGFFDVGWERKITVVFQLDGLEEADHPSAIFQCFEHFNPGGRMTFMGGQSHDIALAEPLGGASYGGPMERRGLFEQEQLGFVVFRVEPGRNDFGVIQDEKVVRGDPAAQVAESGVLKSVGGAVDYEEAGMVPGFGRLGGDEVLGKVEMEVFEAHGGWLRAT